MEKRYIYGAIRDLALKRNKMAFVSGPRQVGKTTLAKSYGADFDKTLYKNWDEISFRRLWLKAPNSIGADFDLTNTKKENLLILDEVHKSKGWKTKVKGIYDELGDRLHILVTGSARLNIYKKGGDSLMGRYLNFRLHPLSYGELEHNAPLDPEEWKKKVINNARAPAAKQKILSNLLKYSGFPEPYFAASDKISNIWRQSRHDKIIREDLRDLSRISELSQVEMLASLLPGKVGSPLSVQSLREDLEVSFDTVKRWLKYLEELYFFFEVKPWSLSLPRSLKKEGKIYLYDYTEVENAGARFENLVAAHLLKACHYWVDTGEGEFHLHYLRNKEKQEVDFLITKKNTPWLMIEVKQSDTNVDRKLAEKFMQHIRCPYLQVVLQEDVHYVKNDVGVLSAASLLAGLP